MSFALYVCLTLANCLYCYTEVHCVCGDWWKRSVTDQHPVHTHTNKHNVKERKRKLAFVQLLNIHFYLVIKFYSPQQISYQHLTVKYNILFVSSTASRLNGEQTDFRLSLLLLLRKSKYHILLLSFRKELNAVSNCAQICQDQSLWSKVTSIWSHYWLFLIKFFQNHIWITLHIHFKALQSSL